ncbi:DUF4214 domain-containing protein [Iamia sp. SCSIO 61187]|uniref:DUF4214 domain-containing protein n=1 Tax=Iamia sp. SCSIO 61187 TaxID=2722752 RepID=UPI001C62D5F5|nr:DUF4214 domain-containing protein [Iamia sp. SCSIO 61187]QYG94704.1 DUF4214 domain-containing protein [Iamia sp. SCSIO 61187]
MTTHTTTTTSTVRRLALLALGLLVLLTGVGIGSAPASAYAPTSPKAIIAVGYDAADDFVRVYWAPPLDTGGKAITEYRIERFQQGQAQVQKVWTQATTAPLVDTTVVPGVTYSYRVRATNADGTSAWSESMVASVQQYHTEISQFGTDAGAFVTRQYQDFLGRNPSFGEKSTAVVNLNSGTWTTGDVIDALVAKPERAHRHQIIRLYNAYFDRNADHGGLEFWSDQITTKGKTIGAVSNAFAASQEFKATYGNLSNAQFVTLVYQNVLDREPDAGGLAYWKGQLDTKAISRGHMMTKFSESAEYRALSRGRVLAADVYDAMIGAESTGLELSLWAAHIQGGGNAGDYGTRTMLLNKY